MTVEEQLRENLERRAASVEVSGDAWDRIAGRLDPRPHSHRRRRARRPRWFVLAAMASVTATAVVATLLVAVGGDRSQRVSTIAQPSTPLTASTTNPAAAVAPSPVPTPTTAYRAGTTTIPESAASSAAAYAGIFPDTPAELASIQQAVDQGGQPWRVDPVSVARTYLATFGIDNPDLQLGPAVPEETLGQNVPYRSGPVEGNVALARLPGGTVYYVTALTSARIETRRVDRQGRTLILEVASVDGGRLTVRSRAPGGDYVTRTSVDLPSPDPAIVSVDLGHDGPAIVRLRLQPLDGTVHQAELWVPEGDTAIADPAPAPPAPPPAAGLTPDAKVRADGIGPITVGMTLDEVATAAGVPFVTSEGPHCRTLAPDWDPATLPAGFPPRAYDLVFTNDSAGRLDMVSVFGAPVPTDAGIGVGSTEEEVLQAYRGQIDVRDPSANGSRWLIHHPADAAGPDYSIVFVVDEGKVVGYRAGRRAVTEAAEPCA